MPEVIEVREYADFLNKKLKNKYINDINILKGRYKKHGPFNNYKKLKSNIPIKVLNIKTKGKFLYFVLDKGLYLFSTLGLRGGWTFYSYKKEEFIFPSLLEYLGNYDISKYKKNALNNLNIEFKVNDGIIYFFDTLQNGTFKVVDSKEELNKKLKILGPDIMDMDTTYDVFKSQIMKKNNLEKPIGLVLVNQKVISGIGNYLRADILWMSKVCPFKLVKDLNNLELRKIYKNSRLLTWGEYDNERGIKLGIIKKSDKLPRDYKRNFFVYKQKTDIYGNPVIKEELYEGSVKRFIYWVKKVQNY
jgi:formamidopyrimidine-DNA glycosylase